MPVAGCRTSEAGRDHSLGLGKKRCWRNEEISNELPGSENGTGALVSLSLGSSQLTAKCIECVFDEPARSEPIGSEVLVVGMPSES